MKVLFFILPDAGHLNPTLPVARELLGRGEEVVYYLTGSFEGSVRQTGADFRRLGDHLELTHLARRALGRELTDGQLDAAMMMRLFSQAATSYLREVPRLLPEVRAEGADLIVYDPMAVHARALARLLDLPAATFYTTYAMTAGSPLVRQLGSLWRRPAILKALPSLARLLFANWTFSRRYGLPFQGPTDLLTNAEALNIVSLPRAFQPGADTLGDRYLFVGPSIAPRGDVGDFPLERLGDRPTLYVSLGSTPLTNQPTFFLACVRAFAGNAYQVVLSTGNTEPDALGKVPPNVLARGRVPQLEVLARTDVFITHGGMNSVMEALWYGVPMVVVPQMPEQALNARRVAELGLGVVLPPNEVGVPSLRRAVKALTDDPAYRERVQRMQVEVQRGGGYRSAADALQSFVAAGGVLGIGTQTTNF